MNKDIAKRSRRRRSEDALAVVQAEWLSLAAMRRYRFVRSICQDRSVTDFGEPGAGQASISAVALSVARPLNRMAAMQQNLQSEVVLHLEPVLSEQFDSKLSELVKYLAPRGVLALAMARTTNSDTATREALGRQFEHVACFWERPVAGSIILDERFAQSRIVPLHDAGPAGNLRLYIVSHAPLPNIVGGLFEEQGTALRPILPPGANQGGLPADPMDFDGPRFSSAMTDIADVLESRIVEPNIVELQERAVTLVTRLMDVEEQTFDLRLENRRLRTEHIPATSGGTDSRFADLPRTRHGWPLAESKDALPGSLGLYDRRVDDIVLLEGRRGEVFFAKFALLDDRPDFGAAVTALNAGERRLRFTARLDGPQPDATIVIPIWGQLNYTLNCLDSLFSHRSKYSAEIIIIDDVSPDVSGDFLPLIEGIRYHRQQVNGGFIQSCTTGAEMARGRYIIMLNNDTRVVDGWLDELLDTFATFPNAGAAGSKLFYPDGVLQEAGGIIWRDGSAWNFGRNDDPNRPQYSYARRVDYVSGCALAVPMELWRSLGGFDQLFRPAYCEDADLCLRITAIGREMWLQPQSRVVHYEGKTSGTDVRVGAKAYQVINQKRLFMRWRERLTNHRLSGDSPVLERERHVRKRALIVDATNPTPKQDAGSVTTTLTLGLFRDIGYKPHFVPQDNFLFQPTYTTDLQRLGIECAYAPYEVDFETYMQRYGMLFDVILVYRVTVLEKIIDALQQYAPQAPVLFHNMDLHFLRMERDAVLEGSAAALEAAAEMKVKECGLIARVDCTITHSTFEKKLLAQEVPDAPVVVWPFMFEFFGTQVGFDQRRDIVFLGGYRHSPNIDAVKFFANDVFPMILAEEPNARFVIAGANPTDEVLALASESVIVTGLVDDLRDVFDTSRLFACSLRTGAGVKGKVSTSMSYGLPVVSTTCGAEGMDLIDGEEVLIADDPVEFAQACLRLYRDRDLWEKISQAGMTLVQKNHSLSMGRRVLGEAIDVAYNHHLGLVA
jgi:GT2 family glycosyltransferase/glycosyltransferase involved in cell wall biosynthesis